MTRKLFYGILFLCTAFLVNACTLTNILEQAVVNQAASAPAASPTPIIIIPPQTGTLSEQLSLPAGATALQVNGQVAGGNVHTFLLNASAGQYLLASVTSPERLVFLSVIAPSGIRLADAPSGAHDYSGQLVESGSYTFRVSVSPGEPLTPYTLSISLTGTPLPQTATPIPPTPVPTRPGTTQRIHFAGGATSAQSTGHISGISVDTYLVNARAGQTMLAFVTSASHDVFLTVISPLGVALASAQAGAQSYSGILPSSGDYTLLVLDPSGAAQTDYVITVSITGGPTLTPVPTQLTSTPTPQPPPGTQRISFASGTSSAQVGGQIAGGQTITYLLNAQAGQRMTISLTSPGGNVYLTVITPGGVTLVNGGNGVTSFDQFLSESGDYQLQVLTLAGTPNTTYTLNVSVPGGGGQPQSTSTAAHTATPTHTPSLTTTPQPTHTPSPQPTAKSTTGRISFAPGGTSASRTGSIDGNSTATFLLNAQSGQRMTISLTSPGSNVYLTVISPGGATLASAGNGVTSFDHFLTESGDYQLQVSTQPGTPLTTYTLSVSVTNS